MRSSAKAVKNGLYKFLGQFYEPGAISNSADKAISSMISGAKSTTEGLKEVAAEAGLTDVLDANFEKAAEISSSLKGGNQGLKNVAAYRSFNKAGGGLSGHITEKGVAGSYIGAGIEYGARTAAGAAKSYFYDPFTQGRTTTGITRAVGATAAAAAIGYGAYRAADAPARKKRRRY